MALGRRIGLAVLMVLTSGIVGGVVPAARAQTEIAKTPAAKPLVVPDASAISGQSSRGWTPAITNGSATPRGPLAPVSPKTEVTKAPAIADATPLVVSAVDLTLDRQRTRLTFDLNRTIVPQVFTLPDPYRVIIDVPGLEFRLPRTAGTEGKGLIKAYRYGLFAAGKSRIVIDTTGPVRVVRAVGDAEGPGRKPRLLIELEATDRSQFMAVPPPQLVMKEGRGAIHEDIPQAPGAKPVIVIDPGHGGVDSGAVSPAEQFEKDIVLAVARHLRTALSAGDRYEIHLTRAGDTFVSLDQRVEFSRERRANLFISLHADALGSKELAQAIRGATVYTLSEQASSREAQLLAEKENNADRVAGVETATDDTDDLVRSILNDLLKRETQDLSSDFKSLTLAQLRSAIALARDPARSAAFRVLRQIHTPSVLIELGYMTNAQDAKLLERPDWQRQVAQAIAGAVDAYFDKRLASGR
jgi:N-acetylmuramoyl-L-alanine amidase